jgi:hypothetical protein
MAELKTVSTPMSTTMSLDLDENGEAVDQREYKSMIGSLLYLTVTWPDISNTHSNLGFSILLLLRLILFIFSMLILRDMGLTERALLVHVIFSDLLLFAGLLKNNLQLLNPP